MLFIFRSFPHSLSPASLRAHWRAVHHMPFAHRARRHLMRMQPSRLPSIRALKFLFALTRHAFPIPNVNSMVASHAASSFANVYSTIANLSVAFIVRFFCSNPNLGSVCVCLFHSGASMPAISFSKAHFARLAHTRTSSTILGSESGDMQLLFGLGDRACPSRIFRIFQLRSKNMAVFPAGWTLPSFEAK